VGELRRRHIIGSVAPYRVPHARLTPSIRNFPEEIEFALRAVREIAAA
jgi:isopenicillin-N epimerase